MHSEKSSETRTLRLLPLLVLPLLLLVSGVSLIVKTCVQMQTTEFVATAGVIIAVDPNRTRVSSGTRMFRITYQYTVEGVRYTSDRYALSEPILEYRKHSLSELETKYRVGMPVTVYYDPKNPAVAVLRTGLGALEVFRLLLGAGMAVVGVGVLVLLINLGALRHRK